MLTATYRVAGTIPLLSPVARIPSLLSFFNNFIIAKWASRDRLATFISHVEKLPVPAQQGYHVTIIHAQDDYDIPWTHSVDVFWHAAAATVTAGDPSRNMDFSEKTKEHVNRRLEDEGGGLLNRTGHKGSVQLEICRYGLHDRIMSYPVVSRAIMRAFEGGRIQELHS